VDSSAGPDTLGESPDQIPAVGWRVGGRGHNHSFQGLTLSYRQAVAVGDDGDGDGMCGRQGCADVG
jgi:hypothetical protein